MLHVLGVDEHFERATMAGDHHIIDGDIKRMLGARPFHLVGMAFQRGRAFQGFGEINHLTALRLRRGFGRGLVAGLADRQNRACHIIRAVGRAAFAALVPSGHIDLFEGVKGNVLGAVDGLGNAAVDPFLRRCLHPHMVQRWQGLGVDKVIGQGRVTLQLAPQAHGVIDHLFLGARSVLLQHLAGIGIGKDWLDPRRNVPSIERNRPRRRDRGQQRVANPVGFNGCAHIGVHLHHIARGEIALGIKQREGALFFGQINRGQIRRPRNRMHPFFGLRCRLGAAIAQAQHQKRIGKAGDTQTNAALGAGFGLLLGKREAAGVHHIVHHPHGKAHQIGKRLGVHLGLRGKGRGDQRGHVDRPKQAGAIGRQGLLAAGVGGGNGFHISKVIGLVDPVDKDHAGFSKIIGVAHDLVPQIARLNGAIDAAIKHQLPRTIGLDRIHEGIGDQHRQVEHPQARGVFLGLDERLNIRVVAAHGGHHGPPARACRHDGAAHRVPDIHKGQGARSIRRHTLHLGPARADGGEVIADAATLLHGQRGLFQPVENAAHAVGDSAHDKAVEQRDIPARASARRDAACGQEFEASQRAIESLFPDGGLFFHLGQCARNAAPAVLNRAVNRGAIRLFEAVLHVPDGFGNGGGKRRHLAVL